MARPFNVFIADELLQYSSGFLTGYYSCLSGMVCILGITPDLVKSSRIIGYWSKTLSSKAEETILNDFKARQRLKEDENSCILLLKLDASNCMHCEIHVSLRNSDYVAHGVVICFKPLDVLQSQIFMKTQLLKCLNTSDRQTKETVLDGAIYDHSLGEHIADVVNSFLELSPLPEETVLCKRQSSALYVKILKNLLLGLSQLIIWILSCFQHMSSRGILRTVTSFSSVCQLLNAKGRRCHKVGSLNRRLVFNRFILCNVSSQHLCDSLAGIVILYFILNLGLTNLIGFSTLDWADNVASRLKDLTQWLMGAPAGLKLNAELTNFLGHFYLYHIYIWTGYLVILRSAMPWIVFCGVWSGIFGLSVQLSFIKDIISLLTIHIYCFYVYGARIFHLQGYALGSLWKLFRGKKWNVLRCRVDSAEYNTDQLFVGTLMFTVLLFLLPTTLLYYAVFTTLRLFTLAAQGLLTQIIAFINDLPVYTLMLRLLKPKLIAGATFFNIRHLSSDSTHLVLNMETSQVPLKNVVELTAPYLKGLPKHMYSWGKLFSSIATGKLLYPWMDAPLENEGSDTA